MQKYNIYIVLTRTNTVLSRLIQYVKNDEYTHAAIALDKELKYMYGFGRKVFYNPIIGGFNHESLDKGLYKYQRVLPGVIMEIEVSQEQYQKARTLLSHFVSYCHLYSYNYKGLLNALLHKEACYDNSFLCSEFVYYILKESGITEFNISRNLVRPQDLLSIEGKIIYKGNLKKYNIQDSTEWIKKSKFRLSWNVLINFFK